ncbi:MAG: PD-(D/E)XK nuclease family protein [Rikenellaceae bacterium]|nr:PD-(D/E)XK nuclease family protein [Rikenellaceae bacterium]
MTVDQIMQDYSGLAAGERIPLLAELYKVYSKFHTETFDSFYYWGEMLLSDFDSIDKYLIDAGMLFRNIAELKELENDNSYLTAEQARMISRFWKSFGHESGYSQEKRRFLDIWCTLDPIYSEFRSELLTQGVGYNGMIYRRAAENIRSGVLPHLGERSGKYIVAGFNALTECEKVLLHHLSPHAEFFWDTDDYYVKDTRQEAGLFIRENMRMFPQEFPLGNVDNFAGPKNITVVASPSDSMQCKYAGEVLGQMGAAGLRPGKETAIVLTDENLMTPLLSSIPEPVEDINVTMGYPLKLTPAYTLYERLAELQSGKKIKGSKTLFRFADLTGLLSHPFVSKIDPILSPRLLEAIRGRQVMYPDITGIFSESSPLSLLFSPCGESWQEIAGYLLSAIALVGSSGTLPGDGYGEDRDHLALIAQTVRRTSNSIEKASVEISGKIFISLVRKILQSTAIPYEGEPLQGVQVMGILETRNLDFKNLVVLSMNDDNFPGNRVSSYSFIPHNLRYAYGLPTPAHHEGVYAYYFYRLLQRAENIHLVYSSKSDEKSSGEQSRYIYQLLYESPHRITRKNIGLDINISPQSEINVPKEGETGKTLDLFLAGKRFLSPSSFNNYIACPLKFYFHTVAGLKDDEEPGEEVDAPMFGSILHKAMDILYKPLCGVADPRPAIKEMIGSVHVGRAVGDAVRQEFLKGEDVGPEDYGGSLLLASDIIGRYIDKCILPFDAGGGPFTILKTEETVGADFEFTSDGVCHSVRFRGNADRVDLLPDGRLRVVDYKTGQEELDFNGIESLFSPLLKDRNQAAFQTMLYGLMLSRTENRDVQPALYYVRNLNAEGYSPMLVDRSVKSEVASYRHYAASFEQLLSDKLTEMFDRNLPFGQCEDAKTCKWCIFNDICRR